MGTRLHPRVLRVALHFLLLAIFSCRASAEILPSPVTYHITKEDYRHLVTWHNPTRVEVLSH